MPGNAGIGGNGSVRKTPDPAGWLTPRRERPPVTPEPGARQENSCLAMIVRWISEAPS